MFTKIILISSLVISYILPQSGDWLTVGLVSTGGNILPKMRFQNNSYEFFHNDQIDLSNYEDTLRKWYFVPFGSNPQYLNVVKKIIIEESDEYENTIDTLIGYRTDYIPNRSMNIFGQHIGICASKEYPIYSVETFHDTSQTYRDIFQFESQKKIEIHDFLVNRINSSINTEKISNNYLCKFEKINLKGFNFGSIGIYFFNALHNFNIDCNLHIYSNGIYLRKNHEYTLLQSDSGIGDCDFKYSILPVPLLAFEVYKKIYLCCLFIDWEESGVAFWDIQIKLEDD